MQQIPVSLLTLVAGILVTLLSIWVGQHHSFLLPIQASEQAPLVDGFFSIMVGIATALFLVVEGTIAIFLWKFRHRPGDDTDGTYIEGSFPLEVFWTAIPTIIVIVLGIYSVDVYTQMGGLKANPDVSNVSNSSGSAIAATLDNGTLDNNQTHSENIALANSSDIGIQGSPKIQSKPADVVVDVTGMQYAWIFNYPQSGITSGELHVPVGSKVKLNIAATDVIHSFWVPQFRLKQDAIPGTSAELGFVATKTGEYPIVCTELCGGYHGSMRSRVIVHTPQDYENWLESSIASNTPESEELAFQGS
ncbi:MAG: cytochrome c oxidase subunit II [Cyanobacteria bacterium P01_A01_bin.45]|mgnify:CR=1 FL=1